MLEWKYECARCRAPQTFSQHVVAARRANQRALPELCSRCEQLARRPLRYLPFETARIAGSDGLPPGSAAALGWLPYATVAYAARLCGLPIPEGKFAVKDSELLQFHAVLCDPAVRVALALAKTGAGKSTYIPMRIMFPPEGDGLGALLFAANGQIVITQPRIKSTRDTPFFVANELIGCAVGARQFFGYKFKDNAYSDWETSLRYVTDGTVVAWLAQELLHRMGLVVIDEAHERSVNIDFIMALLVRAMARNPHVKILIASATIDPQAFQQYFDRFLPGGQRTEIQEFSYFKPYTYQAVFRNPREGLLPYVSNKADPRGVKSLAKMMHEPLAAKIVDIALRMHGRPALGVVADTLDLTQEEMYGDVLAFLHSKKSVADCLTRIEELLAPFPDVRAKFDLIGLHKDTSAPDQQRATAEREKGEKLRIMVATNYAETSLTFANLKHSVDTGLILQKIWNVSQEQADFPALLHSQAGCKQRWGRVGRVSNGVAWMLYTEEQHKSVFEEFSKPKILLEEMTLPVLKAAQAGVDRVETHYFPWMAAESERDELDREMRRAHRRLKETGLIDADGDPTPEAALVEAYSAIGKLAPQDVAQLMSLADSFSCAIEMAAVVAWLAREPRHSKVFELAPEAAAGASSLQEALQATSEDDVAFALGLWSAYEQVGDRDELDGDEPRWQRVWNEAALPPMLDALVNKLHDQSDALRAAALQARCSGDFAAISAKLTIPARAQREVELWLTECRRAFVRALRPAWAEYVGVNLLAFEKEMVSVRNALLEPLSKNLKGKEDRRLHPPFADRVRLLAAWASREHVFVHSLANEDSANAPYALMLPRRDGLSVVGRLVHSVCEQRTPLAFVSLARRSRDYSDRRTGALVRTVETEFAVAVPEGLARALPSITSPELARMIAELPAPAASDAVAAPRDAIVATRSRYPVGAVVRCHVISRGPDGSCQVELGARRMIESHHRTLHEENSDDQIEGDLDETESTSTEEQLFEALFPAVPEVDLELDDQPEDEPEETKAAPPPLISPPAGRVRGVIIDAPPDAQGEILAEVLAHDYLNVGEVKLTSCLTREACAAFARKFSVGDEVPVVATAHELTAHGDYELHVIHKETGLRAILLDQDVTVGYARGATRLIPVGAELRARVVQLDPANGWVLLTLRHLAEAVVVEMLSQTPALTAGCIVLVEAEGAACTVLLSGSNPRAGCVVLAWVERGDADSQAAFQVGQTIALRVARSETPYERLRNAPSAADLQALAPFGIEWHSDALELRLSRSLSELDREKLLAMSLDPATGWCLRSLFYFADRLNCTIMPTRGQKIRVSIVTVLPNRSVICKSTDRSIRRAILPANRWNSTRRLERGATLDLEVLGANADDPDQIVLSEVPADAADIHRVRPGEKVEGRVHFNGGRPAMFVSGVEMQVWAEGRRLIKGELIQGYYTPKSVRMNYQFVAHVVCVGSPNAFVDLVGRTPYEFRQNGNIEKISKELRGYFDVDDRGGDVSLFALTESDVEHLRAKVLELLAPQGVTAKISIACRLGAGVEQYLRESAQDCLQVRIESIPSEIDASVSPRTTVHIEAADAEQLFDLLSKLAGRLTETRVTHSAWFELPASDPTSPATHEPSIPKDTIARRLAVLSRLGVEPRSELSVGLERRQPERPIRVRPFPALPTPPELPPLAVAASVSASPAKPTLSPFHSLEAATNRLLEVRKGASGAEAAVGASPDASRRRVLRWANGVLVGAVIAAVIFNPTDVGPALLWFLGLTAFARLLIEVLVRTQRYWSVLLAMPEAAPRPQVLPGAWRSCANPIVQTLSRTRLALLVIFLGWVALWPLAHLASYAPRGKLGSILAGFTSFPREMVFLSIGSLAILTVPLVACIAMIITWLQISARSQSRMSRLPAALQSRALECCGGAILQWPRRWMGIGIAPRPRDRLEIRRRWLLWGLLAALAILSVIPLWTALAGAWLRYYLAISIFGCLFELLEDEIVLIRNGTKPGRMNSWLASAGGLPGQVLGRWLLGPNAKRELGSLVRQPRSWWILAAHAILGVIIVWTAFA